MPGKWPLYREIGYFPPHLSIQVDIIETGNIGKLPLLALLRRWLAGRLVLVSFDLRDYHDWPHPFISYNYFKRTTMQWISNNNTWKNGNLSGTNKVLRQILFRPMLWSIIKVLITLLKAYSIYKMLRPSNLRIWKLLIKKCLRQHFKGFNFKIGKKYHSLSQPPSRKGQGWEFFYVLWPFYCLDTWGGKLLISLNT